MKTIVILATYIGVVNRGAETFVIELVKKLSNDFNFEIYSLGSCSEISDKIIEIKLKLPFWFNLHQRIYNVFFFYKYICDFIYTVIPSQIEQKYFTKVVFSNYLNHRKDLDLIFPSNGYFGVKFARKFRDQKTIPFIYTGHGGVGEGERKILLEGPDCYVALTKFHQIWASRYSKNVVKINNGVDIMRFKPFPILKKKERKIILCVAALTQFKRQKLLIDAVALVNNVDLVLVGDGEMKDEILEYGKNKIKERFSLISVSYDDIVFHYNQCDIFSLPSINEPFGIVYLEAMAMNKPIVAPNDLSRQEIVGDAGFLCDVTNPIEYAENLICALNMDWKDIPRNRAVLKFSWNKISSDYKKLLLNICDK
jgi:glycosyltransferase involved in cell wall biosynthesis